MHAVKIGCLLFWVCVLLGGCSSQTGPGDQPPADAPSPSPEIERAPGTAEHTRPHAEDAPPAAAPTTEPPVAAPDDADPDAAAPPRQEPVAAKPPEPRSTDAPVEPAPRQPAPPSTVPGEPEPFEPAEPLPSPSDEATLPEPEAPASGSPEVDGGPVVVDVGGAVEVGATKPGLSRIGSEKCKLCHKVQFASWLETAHAKRTPPLDCEGCHGPGSEYKSLSVMKDPEKARAAGLVDPDRSFCAKCHTAGWTDDLMQQAHAHKGEGT